MCRLLVNTRHTSLLVTETLLTAVTIMPVSHTRKRRFCVNKVPRLQALALIPVLLMLVYIFQVCQCRPCQGRGVVYALHLGARWETRWARDTAFIRDSRGPFRKLPKRRSTSRAQQSLVTLNRTLLNAFRICLSKRKHREDR